MRSVRFFCNVAYVYLGVGILQISLGVLLLAQSRFIFERRLQYGGAGTDEATARDCSTKQDTAGTKRPPCTVTLQLDQRLEQPVYVSYELTNVYQNHLEYVRSYDQAQLLGDYRLSDSKLSTCSPLLKADDGRTLNPCGLIANSLFNDVIKVDGSDYELDSSDIAIAPDREKYAQPNKFKYTKATGAGEFSVSACLNSTCSDEVCTHWLGSSKTKCRGYYCSNPEVFDCDGDSYYAFWYPDEENQQYLYESFPEVVSPLQGVKNEHFIVWMKVSALPKFRKLYGVIKSSIRPQSNLTFTIQSNFEVGDFDGKKFVVVSTTSWFGGEQAFLGRALVGFGSLFTLIGIFAAVKEAACPRKRGDLAFLLAPKIRPLRLARLGIKNL